MNDPYLVGIPDNQKEILTEAHKIKIERKGAQSLEGAPNAIPKGMSYTEVSDARVKPLYHSQIEEGYRVKEESSNFSEQNKAAGTPGK